MKKAHLSFQTKLENDDDLETWLADELGLNSSEYQKMSTTSVIVTVGPGKFASLSNQCYYEGAPVKITELAHKVFIYHSPVDLSAINEVLQDAGFAGADCLTVQQDDSLTYSFFGESNILNSLTADDLCIQGVECHEVLRNKTTMSSTTTTTKTTKTTAGICVRVEPVSGSFDSTLLSERGQAWVDEFRNRAKNLPGGSLITGAYYDTQYIYLTFDTLDVANKFSSYRMKINLSGLPKTLPAPEYKSTVVSAQTEQNENTNNNTTNPNSNMKNEYNKANNNTTQHNITLPELKAGHFRVIFPDKKYKDYECNTAQGLLEMSDPDLGPSQVLLHPDKKALMSSDKIGGTSVTFYASAPLSLPLVLPAQFQLKGNSSEGSFAGLEKLFKNLGYQAVQRPGETTTIFIYGSNGRSDNLIVIDKSVEWLNEITQNRKISFLSIVGPPRQGKSTFMNLLKRQFGDTNVSFATSDDKNSAYTVGIWATPVHGTKCWDQNSNTVDNHSIVVFLDSEGLFALDGKGENYHVRMFTIMTVLSSCMIFNKKTCSLADQEFPRSLSELAAKYDLLVSKTGPWIRERIPPFIYLARDWNNYQSLSKDYFVYNSFKEKLKEHNSNDSIGHFWEVFSRFEFVTLPAPLESQNKLDVINQHIHESFKEKLKEIFEDKIQGYLTPLTFRINDESITVQDFSSLRHVLLFIVNGVTKSPELNFSTALLKVVEAQRERLINDRLKKLADQINTCQNTKPGNFLQNISKERDLQTSTVFVDTNSDEAMEIFKAQSQNLIDDALNNMRSKLKEQILADFRRELQSGYFNDFQLSRNSAILHSELRECNITKPDHDELLTKMSEELQGIITLPYILLWNRVAAYFQIMCDSSIPTSQLQNFIVEEFRKKVIAGIFSVTSIHVDQAIVYNIGSIVYTEVLQKCYNIIQAPLFSFVEEVQLRFLLLEDVALGEQIKIFDFLLQNLFENLDLQSFSTKQIAAQIAQNNLDEAKSEVKKFLANQRIPMEKFITIKSSIEQQIRGGNLPDNIKILAEFAQNLLGSRVVNDYQISFNAPDINVVLTIHCGIPPDAFTIDGTIVTLKDASTLRRVLDPGNRTMIRAFKELNFRIPRDRYIVPEGIQLQKIDDFKLHSENGKLELDAASAKLKSQLELYNPEHPMIRVCDTTFILQRRIWFLVHPVRQSEINSTILAIDKDTEVIWTAPLTPFRNSELYTFLVVADIPWSCINNIRECVQFDKKKFCIINPLKENTWVTSEILKGFSDRWNEISLTFLGKIDINSLLSSTLQKMDPNTILNQLQTLSEIDTQLIDEGILRGYLERLTAFILNKELSVTVKKCWDFFVSFFPSNFREKFPAPKEIPLDFNQNISTPNNDEVIRNCLEPLIHAIEDIINSMKTRQEVDKLTHNNSINVPTNCIAIVQSITERIQAKKNRKLLELMDTHFTETLRLRVGSLSQCELDTSSPRNLAKSLFENNLHRFIFFEENEEVPALWEETNNLLSQTREFTTSEYEWKSCSSKFKDSLIGERKNEQNSKKIHFLVTSSGYTAANDIDLMEIFIPIEFKVMGPESKLSDLLKFLGMDEKSPRATHIKWLDNDLEFKFMVTFSVSSANISYSFMLDQYRSQPLLLVSGILKSEDMVNLQSYPLISSKQQAKQKTLLVAPFGCEFDLKKFQRPEDLTRIFLSFRAPRQNLVTDQPTRITDFGITCNDARAHWDSEVYINTANHFKSDRARLESLRVLAMLHTRAVLHYKTYTFFQSPEDEDGRKVPLHIQEIQNTIFDEIPTPKQKWFRYDRTQVEIVNCDTINAVTKYQGSNVLALNMANRHHAGGGYEKGSRAQEEDLFRRTTLSCALTHSTHSGIERPKYPLNEFSSVVTHNVEAFRLSEEDGFYYMERPVKFNVITTAAYNAGTSSQKENFVVLENGKFTEEGWLRTAKNIFGMLSCAAEVEPDILILSALGCGAFRNPPEEVSEIFSEMITLFGGCFRKIVFAIYDKKPDGQGKRMLSNLEVFQHKIQIKDLEKNTLLLNSPSPFTENETKPIWKCTSGSKCKVNTRSHPKLYFHSSNCPFEPECSFRWNFRIDSRHMTDFEHPLPQCGEKEKCTQTHHSHLQSHSHPPQCPQGLICKNSGCSLRHTKRACTYGTTCRKFRDRDHLSTFSHPHNDPCDNIMYCSTHSKRNPSTFSHFCEFGYDCNNIKDPNHLKSWIHLRLPACTDWNCGLSFRENFDDHLSQFQHMGIKVLRPVCPDEIRCMRKEDREHLKQYRHSPDGVPLNEVFGHNTTRHLFEDNEQIQSVNFHKNADKLISRIKDYFKGKSFKPEVISEATEFFSNFKPVHRCSVKTFGLLVKSGFLSSLHYLQTTGDTGECRVKALLALPAASQALRIHPFSYSNIAAFLENTIGQCKIKNTGENKDEGMGGAKAELNRLNKEHRELKSLLKEHFEETLVNRIYSETLSHYRAIENLAKLENEKKLGIGHAPDRKFETNKMVFSVLGPHTLNYGKDDEHPDCDGVHIILSRDILYHPDVFCTPLAATLYASDKFDNETERPWGLNAKKDGDCYIRMCGEKLHPSSKNFNEALAYEFLARTALEEKIDPINVTVKKMMKYWYTKNAHLTVECHLPYMTSLLWVEAIVVHKESFERLAPEDQENAKNLFPGNKLRIGTEKESHKMQFVVATEKCTQRRPCFLFAIPERTTAVLPISISGKRKNTWIFFRAFPNNFVVNLCGSTKWNFKVDGAVATLSSDKKEKTKNDETFNKDHSPQYLGLLYCIFYDNTNSKLEITKRAGAEIFGERKLVLEHFSGLDSLRFKAVQGAVSFQDVRVVYSESDLEENEKIWEPSKIPGLSEDSSVNFNGENQNLTAHEKMTSGGDNTLFSWGKKAWNTICGVFSDKNVLPFCPSGLSCELQYQKREDDPQKIEHQKQFSHVCFFGPSCRHTDQKEHLQSFHHLKKPTCNLGNTCKLLSDVLHRVEFHHPNYRDFMLPCRLGNKCRMKDPKHRFDYCHVNIMYGLEDGKLSCVQEEKAPTGTEGNIGNRGIRNSSNSFNTNSDSTNKYSFEDMGNITIQSSLNDTSDFYNTDAINGDYSNAATDKFGNPIGGNFDLAKDGAFKGFRVIIGCFYLGEGLPESITELTIPELCKKGFEVVLSKSEADFITKLTTEKFHCAWVISSNKLTGDEDKLQDVLLKYHRAGRGLFIFGDNDPYFAHANILTPQICGCRLIGNTPGGKELVPGEAKTAGQFSRKHLIAAGVLKLNEGVTICYPDKIGDGMEIIGTSSNGHPVLVAKDAKKGCGRVVLDNGFTKLMKEFWTSAGTPRYVSNCCVWLVNRERFGTPSQ